MEIQNSELEIPLSERDNATSANDGYTDAELLEKDLNAAQAEIEQLKQWISGEIRRTGHAANQNPRGAQPHDAPCPHRCGESEIDR